MRLLALLLSVTLLAACGGSGAPSSVSARVPPRAWKAPIRDWLAHNGFTHTYSCAAVRAAEAHLPHDRISSAIVIDTVRYEHVVCSHPVTKVDAPADTPAWLLARVHRAAVSLGDPHPTRVRVFLGRDYKLQLWGWFRCFGCSTPNNKTIITGNVATYVYRGHTRELKAFSLAPAATVIAANRAVTVPRLTETDVVYAYGLAHAAGLRVDVPPIARITSLYVPGVRAQSPPSGRRVARGSVVRITAVEGGPIGSPAVGKVRARVPSFVGRPAGAAIGWVESHGLFWELVDLPRLVAGNAASYAGNFVVTSQSPKPGTVLRPGVRVGGGFRPTPLVLHVRIR